MHRAQPDAGNKRQLELFYGRTNEQYSPETVKLRKRYAHSMKSSALMLALKDVADIATKLEQQSLEELEVSHVPPSLDPWVVAGEC